jgi:glucose-1-phosphate adenylyltransferase
MDIIEAYHPEYMVILAGDHIYKMDYELMLEQHVDQNADVTVGVLEVSRADATGFGVMHVDADDRIVHFLEKPADPPAIPGSPDTSLASMGIYVFKTTYLFELLRRDAADPSSSRDFGKDIIPYVVANGKAVAHRFSTSCVKADREVEAYWRDVGTIDAYWEANIDLTSVVPSLDLYDNDWPIWSYSEITAPAKFVHNDTHRRGAAINSLVAGGCIVSGSHVEKSLLFTGVKVHSFATLHGAVVQPYAEIGRGARLRDVVIDRGVIIPPGLVVGEDPVKDAARFRRTEKGRVLITQPMIDRLPE